MCKNILLQKRSLSTSRLHDRPYNPIEYLHRALLHNRLSYHDLAAGDAYKALLLVDEVDGGEYQENVRSSLAVTKSEDPAFALSSEELKASQFDRVQISAGKIAVEAYVLLSNALEKCGDPYGAFEFVERGLRAFPNHETLQTLHQSMIDAGYSRSTVAISHSAQKTGHLVAVPGFKPSAFVRREIYPWNKYEPDRFSQESLSFLNAELQKIAPKCEIRTIDLPVLNSLKKGTGDGDGHIVQSTSSIKQLGIFAAQDVAPAERLFLEPSILTSNNRLLGSLCDACSAPLPPISLANPLPACSSCDDIYFCSENCHDRAQELYHPAVCGIEDFDNVAKDPSPAASTDSLYLLLVIRAIAMAETQQKHPLDLLHVKFLWGDFESASTSVERKLPFDFQNNIANPIHIMTNMGINPFASATLERYDLWVLNTLFAKFRGVASAKMNIHTLRPDVAGVHPLWSLANHSCAPNVRWEWGLEGVELESEERGAIGFTARKPEERVHWGEGRREGGIKKGNEVLNHYCDIDLDVKERREWAIGALGGFCRCERCLWEEKLDTKQS
ncbi:uncharacterized protein KY384_008244 [Bacidia gigantensis]|uniref:uncharacterized protein n=1 Tax=Bacidia gigantensis TaxID=2732470 RepID=UPI001D0587E2|nr:uncharacterized protein KY384_008244 [Bacidia gigantensis]KAG8526815.1 hypothetical protein KY384_008244 [Bacidia gigantensis]